jgi:hypothetical protein
MLGDFPCKLYYTTANCINGDDCMFSHDPLTEETIELLDKMLAHDAEGRAEDEKEVEDLKKQGINPLPKSPQPLTPAWASCPYPLSLLAPDPHLSQWPAHEGGSLTYLATSSSAPWAPPDAHASAGATVATAAAAAGHVQQEHPLLA